MRYFSWVVLGLIFILGFLLRFYLVGSHPYGVLIDEASFGYNAFSILQTGKDEHSVSYPLIFTAFGDQKLPMYAYLLVPVIKFMGLDNLAIRLPSVIAGSLIVLAAYFVAIQYGFSKKQSLLTSVVVATCPWGIIISRFGYESNVGLLFFMLGLASFLTFVKNRKYPFLILTGILFGLTWYSYIAYRFTIPLIILTIIVLFFRSKKERFKSSVVLIASFILIITPMLFTSFSKEGTARFNQVRLLANTGATMEINEDRSICREDLPKFICYGLYNKPVVFMSTTIESYLKTYSIDYLFMNGETGLKSISPKHYGLLPIFIFPFFMAGLFFMLSNLAKRKTTALEIFCLVGLIISPIPSVLAGEPQRVRLTPLFPFIILTITYGFALVDLYLRKNSIQKIYYATMTIMLVVFSAIFMVSFLTIHIKKFELAYASQIPKLVNYISQQPEDTDVYVTAFGYTIYYYLYYMKVPPTDSHQYAIWEEPDDTGFAHITDYKNIHVVWENMDESFCRTKEGRNAIYITDTPNKDIKPIHTINTYDNVLKLFYVFDLKSAGKLDCTKYNAP